VAGEYEAAGERWRSSVLAAEWNTGGGRMDDGRTAMARDDKHKAMGRWEDGLWNGMNNDAGREGLKEHRGKAKGCAKASSRASRAEQTQGGEAPKHPRRQGTGGGIE
jgi:hypothetical protein